MPIYEHTIDGERATKDGKPGWMLDYRLWDDKRKRIVFYGTKTQAESRLARLINEQNEIRSGRKRPIDVNPKRLKTVGKDHRYDLVHNRGKAQSTADRYKLSEEALRDIIGNKYITEYTKADINEFKHQRRADNVSPEGINCDLRQLRALFNFAIREGYLHADKNPLQHIDWEKDPDAYRNGKGVRFFSDEEIEAITNAIQEKSDTEYLELFQMYLFSGARAGEVLPRTEFRWENVDFEQKTVTFNQRKNNKARTVKMVPQVEAILKNRQKRDPDGTYPFDYTRDHVYNILVRKYMRRMCELPDAKLQTIRRTTGALLLKANWNIYDVSKYLDHASVTTTERHYVDLLQKRAENMAEDLGEYIGSLTIDAESSEGDQ